MPFEKGRPKTGGKQRGSLNKRTRLIAQRTGEIAQKFAFDGNVSPLEVQLTTMRYLWQNAHKIPDQPDMQLCREACMIASQAAPYMHPRLASVDAKIEIDTSTQLTEAERRERARQAILEAFAERPQIQGPVIEHEPVEGMGSDMGKVEEEKLND